MAKIIAPRNHNRKDSMDLENRLSAYLGKTLTSEEQLAFENELASDPFLADALDGLKKTDPGSVARSVKQLKKQLHRSVLKKDKARHRSLVPDGYMYWAIAIIIVLAVAAFFVLQLLKHRSL